MSPPCQAEQRPQVDREVGRVSVGGDRGGSVVKHLARRREEGVKKTELVCAVRGWVALVLAL